MQVLDVAAKNLVGMVDPAGLILIELEGRWQMRLVRPDLLQHAHLSSTQRGTGPRKSTA